MDDTGMNPDEERAAREAVEYYPSDRETPEELAELERMQLQARANREAAEERRRRR